MPPGTFRYRNDDGLCTYFGQLCFVNSEQKDADYDVCNCMCIPQRRSFGDQKEPVEA